MKEKKHLGLRTTFKVKKKKGEIKIEIATKTAAVRTPSKKKECSKGWKKRCGKSKGSRCECKCGGTNHGTLRRWPRILKWRVKQKK